MLRALDLSFVAMLVLGSSMPAFAADVPTVKDENWNDWVQNHASSSMSEGEVPLIQNQAVTKAGRFQIMGPSAGVSDRGDFYNTSVLGASLRYHFSENHGWELIRLTASFPSLSGVGSQVQQDTGFKPDSLTSRYQISSSYVFTPIYGKFAWNETSVVRFDLYGLAGGGLRFAETGPIQPYAEIGIGSNFYFFTKVFAIVPEYRLRAYSEDRTQSTFVLESLFQLGVSWLL